MAFVLYYLDQRRKILMGEIVRIFCSNCGAQLDVDNSQQYAKCGSCGQVVENPKYGKSQGISDIFDEETKHTITTGFNKVKSFFSGFASDNDIEDHHHHEDFFDDRDSNFRHRGRRDVFDDEPQYYAVIKRTLSNYSGECPGIAFTSVSFCKSYDECIDKITEKLEERIGSFHKHYEQPSPEKYRDNDPDTRVVRIYPRNRF